MTEAALIEARGAALEEHEAFGALGML